MGKARKRFIDPANSQHFYVVHRSQRDANGDDPEASQYVLLPGRRGNAADRGEATEPRQREKDIRWRDHINELGLPNDGYNYARHLKTMGGGRFIAASGEIGQARTRGGVYQLAQGTGLQDERIAGDEGVVPCREERLKPVVDAITLSADCMDEELERALFGSDTEDGEEKVEGVRGGGELNDDFILQAGKEPKEDLDEEDGEVDGNGGGDKFDFEAHMAMLIAKSEKSLGWAPARGWGHGELESMQRVTPSRHVGFRDSDDEKTLELSRRSKKMGAAAKPHDATGMKESSGEGGIPKSGKHRSRFEEEFEDLLTEYGEEDIGGLKGTEEEASARGGPGAVKEVEDTIEDILDNFLRAKIACTARQGKRDGHFELEVGRKGRPRSSGSSTLVMEKDEIHEGAEEVLEAGADDIEGFIAKHDYLGDRDGLVPWDCETILSTCSNLDNHPSLISEQRGRQGRKMHGKHCSELPLLPEGRDVGLYPENAAEMVALSKKSGLPLGVLPQAPKKAISNANTGGKRDKDEKLLDKRARKAAVKLARREGRARKREMTQAFKAVEKVAGLQSRSGETAVNRSVFQFS